MAEPGLASQSPEVLWKDPLTSTWRGPDPVLIWGRGHVCIFPRSAPGPCWFPERLVKQIDGSPQLTTSSEDEAALHLSLRFDSVVSEEEKEEESTCQDDSKE